MIKFSYFLIKVKNSLFFESLLICVGVFQWVFSRLNHEPLSSETWGTLTTQFPMEFWAIIMIFLSSLTTWGLCYPPNRNIIILGCMLQILHFNTLAYSAFFYGGDLVISAFCWGLLIPLHLKIALESSHDTRID